MIEFVAEDLDGVELEDIHWRLKQIGSTDSVVAFVDFGKLFLWIDGHGHELNPVPKLMISEEEHLLIQQTTFGGDYWHLEANFPAIPFAININGEPYCQGLVFKLK